MGKAQKDNKVFLLFEWILDDYVKISNPAYFGLGVCNQIARGELLAD